MQMQPSLKIDMSQGQGLLMVLQQFWTLGLSLSPCAIYLSFSSVS
jgi:hypothetical protein